MVSLTYFRQDTTAVLWLTFQSTTQIALSHPSPTCRRYRATNPWIRSSNVRALSQNVLHYSARQKNSARYEHPSCITVFPTNRHYFLCRTSRIKTTPPHSLKHKIQHYRPIYTHVSRCLFISGLRTTTLQTYAFLTSICLLHVPPI